MVGTQWGDEGKGKITTIEFAADADVVVRFQGGNNAGAQHTLVVGGKNSCCDWFPPARAPSRQTPIGNGLVVNLIALLVKIGAIPAGRSPCRRRFFQNHGYDAHYW